MARSLMFFFDDGKEYYTFREIASPDFFETAQWCATFVVVAASSHSVFKHVSRSWHVFLMIAWSRLPPHQNTPLQQHVT